jgi:hypothetical protein
MTKRPLAERVVSFPLDVPFGAVVRDVMARATEDLALDERTLAQYLPLKESARSKG